MIYILIATGRITYIGFKEIDVKSVQNIFSNFNFRNVVLSLLSTFGLYFFISLLFLDPFHMFSSFIQYMLLIPFYVNVLNVYAFCNIHDVR